MGQYGHYLSPETACAAEGSGVVERAEMTDEPIRAEESGYNGEDFPSAEDLARHDGQWIAFVGNRIVGSGEDLKTALGAARSAGHDDPVVYYVDGRRRI